MNPLRIRAENRPPMEMDERIIEAVDAEYVTRDSIVPLYIEALRMEFGSGFGMNGRSAFDWPRVNNAIKRRWSQGGLAYIKKKAWAKA